MHDVHIRKQDPVLLCDSTCAGCSSGGCGTGGKQRRRSWHGEQGARVDAVRWRRRGCARAWLAARRLRHAGNLAHRR